MIFMGGWIVIKKIDSSSDTLGLESLLCHFLIVLSWTSKFNLSNSQIYYEMDVTIIFNLLEFSQLSEIMDTECRHLNYDISCKIIGSYSSSPSPPPPHHHHHHTSDSN